VSISLLVAIGIGILAGIYVIPAEVYESTGMLVDIGLCLLLLFVGIDLGKNKDVFQKLKRIGYKALMVPFMVALGSIVGGMLGGAILGFTFPEGGALGAGFGWYSLSAVMLSDYSSELGATAFMANVFRELIALMIVPFVAKYIGYLEAVSTGGATTMDTTLPVIAKSTDSETAMISFISGMVLTLLTPLCVSFMMSLN
jgi:uncharacterized membrane protein YbjE (DUF340 family)